MNWVRRGITRLFNGCWCFHILYSLSWFNIPTSLINLCSNPSSFHLRYPSPATALLTPTPPTLSSTLRALQHQKAMEPGSARAPTIVCTDYVYSWPCGHQELLESQECLSADEPRPHSPLPPPLQPIPTLINLTKLATAHIHTWQDLGDPGYACPTCSAPARPAPGFYAAAGPHANGAWARLAALQARLDTLWRHHTHAVPDHTRRLWIPPRSRLEIRAEMARLAGILGPRGAW